MTFRPDGVLEFADDGKSVGRKKIDIVVSDGHEGGETKGQVDVNVSAKRGTAPALLPDRAVGTEGSDILVEPLRNDASRDGSDLRLRDVVTQDAVEITTDVVDGSFVARTSRAGTYYLDYSAYTSRASANSFVRLDVLPKTEENLPPVASRDQGLIPPGGYALIDLLANDHDPEDGVLAVTAVQTPLGSGVKASLLKNRLLRVEATRDLTAPVSIEYTVSDGRRDAQGSVTVGQAKEVPVNRPPVAADDHVKVRAGAVASVSVLDNDFDPDGDDLELRQSDVVKPDSLPLYVQGDELRFRAPRRAGELRISYGVRDRRGQRDDAELVIDVIADDRRENAKPRPKPVSARAVGAHPVRIGLGLQDADPDGDAVSIRSIASSPSLGRISRMGLDWIEYQTFPTKAGGTDTFEVQVQDRYGLIGVLQVKVCVVPQTPINQPPTALADHIRVRPDRVIQYDVLANDTDPDGDRAAPRSRRSTEVQPRRQREGALRHRAGARARRPLEPAGRGAVRDRRRTRRRRHGALHGRRRRERAAARADHARRLRRPVEDRGARARRQRDDRRAGQRRRPRRPQGGPGAGRVRHGGQLGQGRKAARHAQAPATRSSPTSCATRTATPPTALPSCRGPTPSRRSSTRRPCR